MEYDNIEYETYSNLEQLHTDINEKDEIIIDVTEKDEIIIDVTEKDEIIIDVTEKDEIIIDYENEEILLSEYEFSETDSFKDEVEEFVKGLDTHNISEVTPNKEAIIFRRKPGKNLFLQNKTCKYCGFLLNKHGARCEVSKSDRKRKNIDRYTETIKKRKISETVVKKATLSNVFNISENVVEEILSHRIKTLDKYEFLVKWKHLKEISWEPYANFYDVDSDGEKLITEKVMIYIIDNGLDLLV